MSGELINKPVVRLNDSFQDIFPGQHARRWHECAASAVAGVSHIHSLDKLPASRDVDRMFQAQFLILDRVTFVRRTSELFGTVDAALESVVCERFVQVLSGYWAEVGRPIGRMVWSLRDCLAVAGPQMRMNVSGSMFPYQGKVWATPDLENWKAEVDPSSVRELPPGPIPLQQRGDVCYFDDVTMRIVGHTQAEVPPPVRHHFPVNGFRGQMALYVHGPRGIEVMDFDYPQ